MEFATNFPASQGLRLYIVHLSQADEKNTEVRKNQLYKHGLLFKVINDF